jgi:hypothetical protein
LEVEEAELASENHEPGGRLRSQRHCCSARFHGRHRAIRRVSRRSRSRSFWSTVAST